MKSIIAAGFLLGCAHGAIAGPYANIEANSGFVGSDYGGSVTDVHVGYEGEGWVIVKHPETEVVKKALKILITTIRVEFDN